MRPISGSKHSGVVDPLGEFAPALDVLGLLGQQPHLLIDLVHVHAGLLFHGAYRQAFVLALIFRTDDGTAPVIPIGKGAGIGQRCLRSGGQLGLLGGVLFGVCHAGQWA